jgi:hypothetical protein
MRSGFLAGGSLAAELAQAAMSAGPTVLIRSARNVQVGDFRYGENLMLLGSAAAKPWVELFQDKLDFHIQLDPVLPKQKGRDQNPGPRDPKALLSSISTANTGESYASLPLVKGLRRGRRNALIAQGTMEGTDLAGELAFRPDDLARILSGCGAGPEA